jgi:ankyrin repeat protein
LHAAARKGDTAALKILVKNGADLEGRNDHGWTPLHMAGLTAQAETLDLLLDLGANISARSHADGFRGFTILHCVAAEGTYYMAKILINNRVDVNAIDEYSTRPLARLADKNYGWAKPYRKRDSWDEALAELLMNNGADVKRY